MKPTCRDRSADAVDPKATLSGLIVALRERDNFKRHDQVLARGKPMRRREFITLVGGAIVTWPFAALAQAGRIYRLGDLLPLTRDAPVNVAFFEELRRRGFVEGQNLTIDYRAFAPHVELISQYAAELVKAQPDVIYAGGGMAIRAVQQATKTIPILAFSDDLVGEGLVESLARPNGNTTGLSILATELDGKRQEMLIEAVPGIRRMAALADSSTLTEAKARALQEAARARNIDLYIHRIAKGEEIPAAIDKAHALGADGAECFCVPDAPRQWSTDYGTSCSTAPSGHVSMARDGRGRWLCCLRTTPRSVVRPCCAIRCEPFARRKARRSADRAADQVRAGDKSQDCEGPRAHNREIIPC